MNTERPRTEARERLIDRLLLVVAVSIALAASLWVAQVGSERRAEHRPGGAPVRVVCAGCGADGGAVRVSSPVPWARERGAFARGAAA